MNEERYSHYNYPGTLDSARQNYNIINIKKIFQNLLYNAFSATSTEFQARDYDIKKFQIKDQEVFEAKPRDRDPIYIYTQFPYTNRKYPMLLVSISGQINEIKNYLGWDNIVYYNIINEPDLNLKLGEIVEGRMHTCTVDIGVAALSVDDRDYLCSAIQNIFEDIYRSNYIWVHPDQMHYYQINIGYKSINVQIENSPVTDTSGEDLYPIYTGSVSIETNIEQQLRKVSKEYIFGNDIIIIPNLPNL